MATENDLVTAQTLSQALDLTVDTILRYTRENKIPFIKQGNQYRYRLDVVIPALNHLPTILEKETEYRTDSKRTYTYQDYLKIPEEPGYRYEVLEGELVKDPSPPVLHQFVSQVLFEVLKAYFNMTDPGGLLFYSPLDVTFGDTTVVQPDILYLSSKQRNLIKGTHIDGAPTLAVEIVSPSTHRKDNIKKLDIYQKAGVKHYWLVDPENKTLQAFSLKGDVYLTAASGEKDNMVEHPNFPGLIIALHDLWNMG